jgi:prephenate dehydratase
MENIREVFGLVGDALPILNPKKKKFTVAYLGPKGTFSEQAARRFFSNQKNVVYAEYLTIQDVFRAVEAGKADYGVVPVENSIEGSVNLTLDLLYQKNLKITGEITERIEHSLIVNPLTKKSDIKIIVSHPQAIAQCRNFLAKNFPRVRFIEVESTALAVKKLKTLKKAAAIGSEYAAKIYGMKILARNIGDVKNNLTRFFILSKKDSKPTGNDKTSLMFSLKHEPGALFKFLKPFAEKNINLTKIESRPSKVKPWEYVFLMEFEGHRLDKKCLDVLKEARKLCETLKVLGSYPKQT